VKAALAIVLTSLTLFAGAIALVTWRPWDESKVYERELDWLRSYVEWADGVEAAGGSVGAAECRRSFERAVPQPPSDRLKAAAATAERSCGAVGEEQWVTIGSASVFSDLLTSRRNAAQPLFEARLSRVAGSLARDEARVFCWEEDDWTGLAEEFVILRRDELWPSGFADPFAHRIDLAAQICDPLRRFFTTLYTPSGNTQTFELAEALVVLAHEAEHVRSPSATEAAVQCFALQGVRGLVRAEGRSPSYAREMALLVWELGYERLPEEYRTPKCRNGGPLDRRQGTSVWP
jgi:hypothetical protein